MSVERIERVNCDSGCGRCESVDMLCVPKGWMRIYGAGKTMDLCAVCCARVIEAFDKLKIPLDKLPIYINTDG